MSVCGQGQTITRGGRARNAATLMPCIHSEAASEVWAIREQPLMLAALTPQLIASQFQESAINWSLWCHFLPTFSSLRRNAAAGK